MKKLWILLSIVVLVGCAKVSEAEQYINDNPEVFDEDPVLHYKSGETEFNFYEVNDDGTKKILYTATSDELIVLYMYCESGIFDATTEYEQRIYDTDTFYGLTEKPKCDFDETLSVYYNEQKANGDWVFLGEISGR